MHILECKLRVVVEDSRSQEGPRIPIPVTLLELEFRVGGL